MQYSNPRSLFKIPTQHRRTSPSKKLSSALREYAELFELSPASYFILDDKGIIENVNERGSNQLGMSKPALVGCNFSKFIQLDPDKERFESHKKATVSGQDIQKMEVEITRNNGTSFSAIIKSKVTLDEYARFKHILSIVTDISAIKEHEHEMETQLLRLKELNTLKSKFIGMASHEFRTPLTSMLSGTTLIEKYAQLGETVKILRHLTRMKSSIHRLVSILDEFLSIEKLESGNIEVKKNELNLKNFCESIIEEFAPVLKKGQRIKFIFKGKQEILSDERILQHILLNLLSNASKYSAEESEVSLTIDISNQIIFISVTDSGIGIPEADQGNIFSNFFRAENTGNIEGTGLGLNIVKRYVELLEGSITFSSKLGEGTTFMVEIPNCPLN